MDKPWTTLRVDHNLPTPFPSSDTQFNRPLLQQVFEIVRRKKKLKIHLGNYFKYVKVTVFGPYGFMNLNANEIVKTQISKHQTAQLLPKCALLHAMPENQMPTGIRDVIANHLGRVT